MFKNRAGRSGFTLPEVLVTVAIVAVLAAAVVPAVTSQLSKGEEGTVVSAITSVRTGITAFTSDVRAFPGELSNLTNAITLAQTDLEGNTYSAAQVARWKGPYTTKTTCVLGDSLPIGLGAFVVDSIKDSLNFMVLTINNVHTVAQADGLEALFESVADSSGGVIRWSGIEVADSIENREVKVFLTSSR